MEGNIKAPVQQQVQVFYDFATPNKSFVNMHIVLKELGIDNNKFFLMLFDRQLSGVNPHDKNLHPELVHRVVMEVKCNYWYWLREVCRVFTEDGYIRYKLHIGNLSMNFLALQNFSYYHEQSRQTGKTIGDSCLTGYQFAHGTKNTKFGIYSYDNAKVSENIRNIMNILEGDPEYLKVHTLTVKETEDNTLVFKEKPESAKKVMSLDNDIMNNHMTGKTTGNTVEGADKAGKGATQAIQIWDEVGFCKNVEVAYGSAIGAFGTAADRCRASGLPYRIAMTSTPPDTATKEGKWLEKFVFTEMVKFDPKMFDWTRDQLEAYMKKNAEKDFWFISYEYFELGYTEEWLVSKKRLASTYQIFARDFLLVWSKDIKDNPFDPTTLSKLKSHTAKVKPELFHMDRMYTFKLYPNFHKARFKKVVIGVDVSGGIGGDRDSSTMCGIDPETTEVLFTFENNGVDTNEFSHVIYSFVAKYCPNALLVVERNSYGKSIVDNLKRTELRDNLYHTRGSENDFMKGVNFDIVENNSGRSFGIFNRQAIRNTLFTDILALRVKNHKELFLSNDIYDQICNLVEKNGRIDHKSGTHDDLLIAYLFALYALLRDNDLNAYFGIPRPIPKLDGELTVGEDMTVDRDVVANLQREEIKIDLTGNRVGNMSRDFGAATRARDVDDVFREMNTQIMEARATVNMGNGSFVEIETNGGNGSGDLPIDFNSFYGGR
ncbi:MAG: hypothetical protein ACRC92_04225 [Peptostreptococcaceae bacterium]